MVKIIVKTGLKKKEFKEAYDVDTNILYKFLKLSDCIELEDLEESEARAKIQRLSKRLLNKSVKKMITVGTNDTEIALIGYLTAQILRKNRFCFWFEDEEY